MNRRRIDMRTLPSWLQWTISLAIVVVVSLVAWQVGKEDPVPAWVAELLVPGLGILFLVLLVVGLAARAFRRSRR
ncbi:MAG: hypothetical protein GY856_26090 [bacterium]|nr:hypothetical protein [bacterium]